jgi:hypothetical protein
MALWFDRAWTSNLAGGDPASDSFFRRFGDGSSGVDGVGTVGEDAAALCMNFIVKSLEDIDFGALPGVLVPLDILEIEGKYVQEIVVVTALDVCTK